MNRHTNLDIIMIEDRRYPLERLNPLEAFSWASRTLSLISPAISSFINALDMEHLASADTHNFNDFSTHEKKIMTHALAACAGANNEQVTQLLRDATQRCYTPHNEPLSDEAVFNRWFTEHPHDMFTLSIMALITLVKGFFPNFSGTTATKNHEKETVY